MDGDYTAISKCDYCEGTMVAIFKNKGKYLVQCEDCGMVTCTYAVLKNNNKPSRMKMVRKLKRKYHKEDL